MTRGQTLAGKAVILVEAVDLVDKSLRTVENKFKKFGNTLGQLGRTTFGAGFFGSFASIGMLARFAKFDDLLLELRVKMGLLKDVTAEQAAEFTRLEKRIRSLGKTTSYTAQEVAEGAIRLAQAGFSGKEIEDTLQSVLDLARGTSTDLGNAARVLANAMRTFNLETTTANEVVSQFVRASRYGTVEIDDLAESLKYASATAVTLGQSLPEVLAVFTLLSDKGLRGSISGTSFNTALSQIAKKSEDIKAAFGFDVPVDNQGSLMFIPFLQNLQKATQGMNKLEKAAVFGDIFNLRGVRSVLPIANEKDLARILELTQLIGSAQDEARQAAVIMDSGLGGAIRRATSAIDDLNLSLQKTLDGPLSSLLGTVPILAGLIDTLAQKYQGFTMLLLASPAIALGAGASLMILGKALKTVGSIAGLGKSAFGEATGFASKGLLPRAYGAMRGRQLPSMGLNHLGKFPTGAASAIPNAPGAMSGRSFKQFQSVMAKRIAMAERELALSEDAFQLATKTHVSNKVFNSQIAQRTAIYQAQEKAGRSVLLMEKELQNLNVTRVTWEQKLATATRNKNVAAATNAGKHIQALKAEQALLKGRIAMSTEGALGLTSAVPGTLIDTKNSQAALQAASQARMAATAKVASMKNIAGGAIKAKSMGFLPQILSGVGKAGGIVKNIGALAAGFGKLSFAVGRFVFSANGLAIIAQVILMFGNRIPIVKDALANIGNAFVAFGKQIMGIGAALGPVLQLMKASFSLLGDPTTQDLGFAGLVDSLSLMGDVIKGKLSAAFSAFKSELGWVYDTAKLAVGVLWELLTVVFEITKNSIGNVIANFFDVLESRFKAVKALFGGESASLGDLAKSLTLGLSTIVAELFNWVGYAIIRLNTLFYDFIDNMEMMLLRIVAAMPLGTSTSLGQAEIWNRKTQRKFREQEDLAANDTAMARFREAITSLGSSNAAAEGALGVNQGNQSATAAGSRAMERLRELQEAFYIRQQQLAMSTAGPGSPGVKNTLAAPTEAVEEIKATLRGIASALVGSGSGTRGNVTRAVTENELKKQTQLLEDIKVELSTQNTRGGYVFRL